VPTTRERPCSAVRERRERLPARSMRSFSESRAAVSHAGVRHISSSVRSRSPEAGNDRCTLARVKREWFKSLPERRSNQHARALRNECLPSFNVCVDRNP
jgi:hypothetical protein